MVALFHQVNDRSASPRSVKFRYLSAWPRRRRGKVPAALVAQEQTILTAVTPIRSSASKPRHASLRLLYIGTGLLILLLLAINAGVIAHLRESELLDVEGQMKSLSLILAEQADRTFQSVDLVLSSVVEGVAAEGVTDGASFDEKLAGQDVHLLLQEKISGVPQLDALIVLSREGKVINFSRPGPIPDVNNSDRAYFRAFKADPNLKTYISEPVKNRGTGSWLIFLARRVNGPNGEFLGIILGAIEPQYFEVFYRAISHADDDTVALQRFDGVILARVPQQDTIGKVFPTSQHFLSDGVSGVLREPSLVDGRERIKAAQRLTDYPLLMVATKTEKTALANWRGIAQLMSLGALGCAVAIALAGFALARQWQQQAMLAQGQADLRRQEDRTEIAEAADHGKSQFLANMSHEVRTPLNAVLGFSELLMSEAFGPLGDERYRGYAQDIHSSGSHLLGIVNDILDLSKAASGKLALAEDWFDARNVVNLVCRLIQPRVDEGKLSLTVKMPPGDLILYADERLLRQMLLNLLSNACKFTPHGGHIDCSISVDAAGMMFAVTDTGIGIPPTDLERVLEPFAQIDSSLSRGQQGSGLGLAIVKVMAELHGGCLRLASEMGSGTIASLILPLSRTRPGSADVIEAPAIA
jgi:signal transduction histidine kinase